MRRIIGSTPKSLASRHAPPERRLSRGIRRGRLRLPRRRRERGGEKDLVRRGGLVGDETVAETAIEPLDVEGSGSKLGVADESAEERKRRLDARDLVVVECAGQPGE